tara:strand:+ start:7356 stop:7679 length:324 start_codon:yes stop_codon:yes gene_type:complete
MVLHESIYIYSIYISYILYLFVILGVTKYAPEYLNIIKNIIKIYVAIILIIKFNPINFKQKKLSEFDNNLIFSSGLFLLLSTSIISILEKYFLKVIKIPINDVMNDV